MDAALRPPVVDAWLSYHLFGWWARLFRGIEYEGLENVPKTGGVIVAGNHVSFLDPPLIAWVIDSVRWTKALGKKELLDIPVFGWLLKRWGVVPVSRGRMDIKALRGALKVLSDGGLLMIMPEGTRAKPGKPLRPKPGVALLARESGVPVVPARVRHTDVWFSDEPLRVRFGSPIRYDGGDSKEAARGFAERVMEEIWKL